ncbi:MAG: hypothetical protein ICV60_21350 [Pyrinomonadaceae bacterium]|nr:hypothetical protein [Pyrinomonadaceae bacterium]
MRNFARIIAYMLAGAVAFWTPDILLHVRRGYEFASRDMLLLTVLLPWVLFSIYRVLLSLRGKEFKSPSIAFYMLLGVWMLGSSAMTLGAAFTGGGLPHPGEAVNVELLTGLLPSSTFTLAAFDGSLTALLVSTILMIFLHLKYERGSWIIPPAIFREGKKLFRHSEN